MLKGRPFREILDIAIICFVIACLIGTLGEQIFWGFDRLFNTGSFVWESRSGLMYGPFAPLYGIGILLALVIFGLKDFKWWQCFLIGAFAGGAYEFIASLWQEICFGTRSWDYSSDWDSIGGRTKISYLILWGLVAIFFAKVALPWICKIYDKLPKKPTHVILVAVLVFLVLNVAITLIALNRQSARHDGIEASNGIEYWLDATYPDERIHSVFEGTKFIQYDDHAK